MALENLYDIDLDFDFDIDFDIEEIKPRKNNNKGKKKQKKSKASKIVIKPELSLKDWQKELKKQDKRSRKTRAKKAYSLHQKLAEVPDDKLSRFNDNLKSIEISYINSDMRSTFINAISGIEGQLDDENGYIHDPKKPMSFNTKVDNYIQKKRSEKKASTIDISPWFLKRKYYNERNDMSHGVNKCSWEDCDVEQTLDIFIKTLKL